MTAKQPTILVVDDEEPVRRVLCTLLETEGFVAVEAAGGRDCMRLCYNRHPDLVLLDILMPDHDGRRVCQDLRTIAPDLPIIMLTALSDDAEKIARFADGADDFVTKPFNKDELISRIKALLRRANGNGTVRLQNYDDGILAVDFELHQVQLNGKRVPLAPKEWRLLECLIAHKDQVVTIRELLRAGWGSGYEEEARYVKVCVSTLRHKLGDKAGAPRYIHTVRAEGYLFKSRA